MHLFRSSLVRALYLLSLPLLVTGCYTQRDLVYFQGKATEFATQSTHDPVIKPDDILSILVMATDEKSVLMFNMPLGTGNNLIGGYAQGAPTPPGYLVHADGTIDFPIIGSLKIAGLTRSGAVEMLKQQLASYIVNPTISIRILNFRVTVLGEVRNPGTFTIPNERISLLEALGIAGDLLITGERKNVAVIRDEEGKRREYRVNLTDESLFSSPVFYLQQNDVVYVEPNQAKRNSSLINVANYGVVISSLSLVVTTLILIFK
ncbi:MAG: polysaccharide biosynthesis/export family protein [bacterium]